jgi:hypothetical protein
MPSSTSSSSDSADRSKFDRPLPEKPMRNTAITAFVICAALMSGWEMYWRDYGVPASYRNSEGLWTIQRRRIDNGEGDKTVLTGSSRVYFNTQLDVWEAESGQRPIQLALEGTSPLRVMEGLADDDDFTGTLIVGVAPGLFFSGFEYRQAAVDRYGKETPTQWLGQQLSMPFEPYLRFYHFDYALFQILHRQNWPVREGWNSNVTLEPRNIVIHAKDRNSRLWSKVADDEEYRNIVRKIWASGFVPLDERDDAFIAMALEGRAMQIDRAAAATKKLHERGVDVIFVRNPAEGHFAMSELMFNPRAETWDVLIEKTGALGIHWMDHEELQGFYLPEWSHMTGAEADRFTKALYHVVQRELVAHRKLQSE